MAHSAEQHIFDWRPDAARYTGASEALDRIAQDYSSDISHLSKVNARRTRKSDASTAVDVPMQTSTSMVHLDDLLDEVSKPAERRLPNPRRGVAQASTFTPNHEWEGYVVDIKDDSFLVNISDVRDGLGAVTDQAEFSLQELPELDQRRIEIGSIVRWLVGLEILPNDQRQRVSRIHLRRLPVFTKSDIDKAFSKADSLLDGLVWNDATSG